MINSRDISVVIQGPVIHEGSDSLPFPITVTALNQIRSLLPDAQIILSTWKGENTSYLASLDDLVSSDDPGTQGVVQGMIPNNVNRQIVSTRSGLEKATRKYTLKIRSDIFLESLDFIGYFENGLWQPKSAFSIFDSLIISNNFSSRNPLIQDPGAYAYHPSDHVHFGITDDLIKLWSIPLQSNEEALWFNSHVRPINLRLHETSRLAPEQYLFINSLAAAGRSIDLIDFADARPEVIQQSESYMSANFLFIPDKRFSFHFPKYHTFYHDSYEYLRRNSLKSRSLHRRYEIVRSYLSAFAKLLNRSFL